MKLLVVCDFYHDSNTGAAGSLITIGNNLNLLNHEVDYIWRKEKRFIKSNNFYRFLELPFVQYQQIKNVLQQEEVDVIIVSQPHAWYAFKRLRKKYPNILFVNRTHGWEFRIQEISKQLGKKKKSLFEKFKFFVVSKLLKHCSYATIMQSDAVFCAGTDDSDYIKKQYPTSSKRVFSIGYGLSPQFLNLIVPKRNSQVIKLLYVGQYLERKGIKDIKIVLSKIQELSLAFEITFVVNEESIAKVKDDFAFIPSSSLKVSGWMKRDDLIDTYMKNDVFLMPSYGEGFGKTIIEAMACQLCVIGYREGALSDIGSHEVNGLIYDKGDIDGFTNGIIYLINNQDKLSMFKINAYKDVQKYTWLNHCKQTIDILKTLKD
jgi:glycosyltransferase involved in cell wall biosynthesis